LSRAEVRERLLRCTEPAAAVAALVDLQQPR
jgi:hypothetical protein